MQIQKGKLYENRTWLYLYPSLQYYGRDLSDRLSSFFKLGTAVGDAHYKKSTNVILILFDLNLPFSPKGLKDYQTKFEIFLRWLRYQSYYEDDYMYDEAKGYHIVAIKLPEHLENSYKQFIEGNYSLMYTPKQIEDFFKIEITKDSGVIQRNERYKKVKKVFSKDKEVLKTFVEKVNKEFNTSVSISLFKDAEVDYPPKKEEEIFNFKG